MINNSSAKYDLQSIPEELKDYISDVDTSLVLYRIAYQKFGTSSQQASQIVDVVWELYFSRIKYEKLRDEIARVVSDGVKVDQIVGALQNELLRPILGYLTGGPVTATGANVQKVLLSVALEKLPRLGEQMVTENSIKIKIFPTLVRPSIKNWISDYYEKSGGGKHGAMERGDFLFNSENAKKLTTGERQRLAMVLKALDEGTPVPVDTDRQEIVFAPEPMAPPQSSRSVAPARPAMPQTARPVVSQPAQPARTATPQGAPQFAPRPQSTPASAAPRPAAPAQPTAFGMPFDANKPVSAVSRNPMTGGVSPARSTNAGSMQFSSPHQLPVERKEVYRQPAAPSAAPVAPQRPVDPKVSGNTVDLRN